MDMIKDKMGKVFEGMVVALLISFPFLCALKLQGAAGDRGGVAACGMIFAVLLFCGTFYFKHLDKIKKYCFLYFKLSICLFLPMLSTDILVEKLGGKVFSQAALAGVAAISLAGLICLLISSVKSLKKRWLASIFLLGVFFSFFSLLPLGINRLEHVVSGMVLAFWFIWYAFLTCLFLYWGTRLVLAIQHLLTGKDK